MMTRTAARYRQPAEPEMGGGLPRPRTPSLTPRVRPLDASPAPQPMTMQPATPQNPPPVQPMVAGASVQPIDPAASLRGQTIQPQASSRLQQYQGEADRAVSGLSSLPDRYAIAQERFNTSARDSAPEYEAAVQAATRAAAAQGQTGSGMLRTRYGTLASDRIRSLDTARSNFLTNALEGSIADRYNTASVARSYAGDIAGEEAANRGELRGERGYTDALNEQDFSRRLAQYRLQQDANAQQFGQGVTLSQLGFAGNPADAYGQAAGAAGQEAGALFGGVGSLVGNIGRRRALDPNTGLPPGYVDPTSLEVNLDDPLWKYRLGR